jgi:serine/threonine-protein phosphatase 6 regulatory ankyrin repeat subunit B
MRGALSVLPATLEAMYEKALATINRQSKSDKDTALKTLSFLSCAKRPLALSELLHSLSVGPGQADLVPDACPLPKILLGICAGLIQIDGSNDTVSLTHYTLQQHMENLPGVLSDGHHKLGWAALLYLSYNHFLDGPRTDEASLIQRCKKYSFLDYAAHHCGYHLSMSGHQDWSQHLLETIALRQKREAIVQIIFAPRSARKTRFDDYPRDFKSSHLFAHWGLSLQLDQVINGDSEANSQDSDGTTALHLAAAAGHLSVVQILLGKGADIGLVNSKQQHATYFAARNGHPEVLMLLLSRGASAADPDLEGYTALDWTIVNGHNSSLEMILSNSNSAIQMIDETKNRALALAAEAGKSDMIIALLENGASVDWQDEFGNTALGWAVAEGHLAAIETMLKHGADVQLADEYLNTPLHWAVPFTPILNLFVAHGADLNAQNNTKQTPLMWGVQDGHVESVMMLLSMGAKVNLQDKFGFTALHAASLKGYTTVVEALLDYGASTTIEDNDGWSPLHAAALENNIEVIELLRDKTPDSAAILDRVAVIRSDENEHMAQRHMANQKSEGSTACTGLRMVVQFGQIERIQTFLNTGVDINAADVGGSTALTLGAWLRQVDAVQLLLENGADVNIPGRDGKTALHLAAEDTENQEAMVTLLTEWGADVNANAYSFTPVLLAASMNHEAIVRRLITCKADIKASDYHGRTALHHAACNGNKSLVETLLCHNADVNAPDRKGKTPLMCAVEGRSTGVLVALLQGGADIDMTDQDGCTALHLAVSANEVGIVRELLDNGAADDIRDLEGSTALHIAFLQDLKIIIKLLVE